MAMVLYLGLCRYLWTGYCTRTRSWGTRNHNQVTWHLKLFLSKIDL